ncbi:MAG: galactose mutarotase [Armatimonadetes bacterium]|nr:galactose mutarotase [Armatimonadota bacterium]
MQNWGEVEGQPVSVYTLTNNSGMTAKIATYGAILTELHVPDKIGAIGDVVLGFDTVGEYVKNSPYFGATVGRVANRIAKGRFTLDGKEYTLAVNNDVNHLHGGVKGWDKKIWTAEARDTPAGASVTLRLVSPDGEEGYPGTVQASVTYTVLRDSNTLRIEYEATTDKATPINLTNHSYFNLKGDGDVYVHEATLNADSYTPTDATQIPTGTIAPVAGTPFDFRTTHPIGARIRDTGGDPLGYDHNFVRNSPETFGLAARVSEPFTGRVLTMSTSEPGFQFYTGNFMDGKTVGKRGVVYATRGAFCLEAQHFPDAVNQSAFAPIILRPGETYRQRTEYIFSLSK